MTIREFSVNRFTWLAALLTCSDFFSVAPLHGAEGEAVSPIVPGFQRFFTADDADKAAGGRLLLGELNCLSCHRAEKNLATLIDSKKAPVLDNVGARIKPEYLAKFLSNPHATKPGTTMPDLLAGMPVDEKQATAEALSHFLASTGNSTDSIPDLQAAGRGEGLFHRIGCIACHNSRKPNAPQLATSVPLGNIAEKYTVASLNQFLRNPHAVRPSGRMPNLNLDEKEAIDLANYFFRDAEFATNMHYAYYDGNWEALPDLSKMTPKKKGESVGFDLNPAPRKSNFGMQFTGWIHLTVDGEYTFFLGSDDGSKLYIDEKLVVNNDGIHPHTTKSGKATLTAGAHKIRVDYMQGGGEWTLTVEVQGPQLKRQPAASLLSLTEQPPQQTAQKPTFSIDPALVEKGRELFVSVGCASCHQLRENNQPLKSKLETKPLANVQVLKGCLAETPAANVPRYRLDEVQRASLAAAMTTKLPNEALPMDVIATTMTTFNCYACHSREKVGGPERDREATFVGTIPEMGDEGRIPPALDGAGDKLKESWLKHILANGAKDRPYMHTRMPKFGGGYVAKVVSAFKAADEKTEEEWPEFKDPEYRVKADGRYLVGDKALSCIKCHYFDKYKATGIQAMDLTTMTQRLRRDWFQRYMVNPQDYRPGTRMPAAWPFGQATVKEILDANAHTQIAAVWLYMADGKKAPVPSGLVGSPIVLKPESEPIIYRNFIEGVSPRGIAVGYPEKANLAFDADKVALRLIWHGAFIDAARHWNGRGVGFEPPLGDHVLKLPDETTFAVLESQETSWPTTTAKELGYRFQGYRLDKKRRPIFRYANKTVAIEDILTPMPGEPDTGFERTLTLSSDSAPQNLWYRAAVGDNIEPAEEGWYVVDGALRTHVSAGDMKPVIRTSNGKTELLLPVGFAGGRAVVTQKYSW